MKPIEDLARQIAELREPTATFGLPKQDLEWTPRRAWQWRLNQFNGQMFFLPRPLDAALVLELLEEMPAARLEKHKDEGNEDIYWLCRPTSDRLMSDAPTKEMAIALAWLEWKTGLRY